MTLITIDCGRFDASARKSETSLLVTYGPWAYPYPQLHVRSTIISALSLKSSTCSIRGFRSAGSTFASVCRGTVLLLLRLCLSHPIHLNLAFDYFKLLVIKGDTLKVSGEGLTGPARPHVSLHWVKLNPSTSAVKFSNRIVRKIRLSTTTGRTTTTALSIYPECWRRIYCSRLTRLDIGLGIIGCWLEEPRRSHSQGQEPWDRRGDHDEISMGTTTSGTSIQLEDRHCLLLTTYVLGCLYSATYNYKYQ
jgi:hypothetical protein